MLKLLIPDLYIQSIYSLDTAMLRSCGIRGLIVDLDNTLVTWRYGQPDQQLVKWVESLRSDGIEPCIVSNNRVARVQEVGKFLGIPSVGAAVKPRRRAFRRAMEQLGTPPAETAVLGDQIFTDVLGARRLGLYSILVVPISERELLWTQLVRRLERRWLKWLVRRGLVEGPR